MFRVAVRAEFATLSLEQAGTVNYRVVGLGQRVRFARELPASLAVNETRSKDEQLEDAVRLRVAKRDVAVLQGSLGQLDKFLVGPHNKLAFKSFCRSESACTVTGSRWRLPDHVVM